MRSNAPADTTFDAPADDPADAAAGGDWARLSPEIREMIVANLGGRDLSRFARSAHASSQSSAASLLRRSPSERNAELAQLVEHGAAPTIATLLQSLNPLQFDWGQRDATGATLLMRALRDGSRAVVETLVTGPACLFAGMDASGWNVLHHAVSRGQACFLRAMLEQHPVLAAYADLSGNQAGTPLQMAYAHRDAAMFDLLLATPAAHIEALIMRAGAAQPADRETAPPLPPLPPLPLLPEWLPSEWLPAMVRRMSPPITPPPVGAYPFDPTGRPVSLAARQTMSNGIALRQPAATRLELLKTTISDHEPVFAQILLNALDAEALAGAREDILRSAIDRGQFAAARIVIDHFGERAFAPLSQGATLCHLAARRMDDDLLNWVLRKPAARTLLDVRDDDGRTPLHCAAAEGSVRCFAALQCHSPDLTLRDAYAQGVLQLLFRADPAAAHRVLDNPTLRARLTPADLTATLQTAFRKLLEFDFAQSWQVNDENTLEVNTRLVDTLLSLPAGRIDVHAPVGASGHSILTLLESGVLSRVLDQGSDDEQHDASESVRGSYAHYENAALLARARAHRDAPNRAAAPLPGPAAPPPGPAVDLL